MDSPSIQMPETYHVVVIDARGSVVQGGWVAEQRIAGGNEIVAGIIVVEFAARQATCPGKSGSVARGKESV